MPAMATKSAILTPEAIEARIWQELSRASRDRHHEWRTPTLASVNAQRQPNARTVVLRRVDIQAQRFTFYTDRRSPKCVELAQQPRAIVLFWSKRLGWQLRVSVEVEIQVGGAEFESLWAQISQTPGASDYLSADAPGSAIDTPIEQSSQTAASPHYFALLDARVIDMDWLELDRAGHRRALISPKKWIWRVP